MVLIVYVVVTDVYVRAETCEDVRTKTISDRYFGGSGYKTVSPCGYQQCLSLCMAARECQSINYELVRLTCELNTDTYKAGSSLSAREGNVFKDVNDMDYPSAMAGRCQKSTCPEYHTCVKLSNGSTVCIAPVPDTQISTVGIAVAAFTCEAPFTLDQTAGLCLYYGTSYNWSQASTYCPSSARLYVADTEVKRAVASSICPPGIDCWLGATYSGSSFVWTTGDLYTADSRGSGDCLRVKDSVFTGGLCSLELSYICELI
ncbi:uncharacterized protein [Argopecten irradians]|uniref:uncharacterized protein n=1 Tax=Argopecten irradians TaxID=31199 RepID=UPI00371ED3EA